MKIHIYILLILSGFIFLNSCSDDDKEPGNPLLDVKTTLTNAMFGDSLVFTADVSDSNIPLSTLKAQLFFDDEMVSETVIRTKEYGTYTGKIFIPFYKDIPNGTAKLKLILQNINFTIKEETYDLTITRPDYPSLIFVTADGEEYTMVRKSLYEYAATETFPQKIRGYIKAPAMGQYGNDITFGWEDKVITEGSTNNITFSNANAGEYSITFNTLTYEASPFIIAYLINGHVLTMIDDNNYTIDLDLTQEQEIVVEGIDEIADWWIDPDFFTKDGTGKLSFAAISGKYRITASFDNEYLKVESLNAAGDFFNLQADGTGAMWIIGENVGKPNVANGPGWNDQNSLCMPSIGNKKFQITLVAGKSITATSINFKFFGDKLNWGQEYKNDRLSTTSDLIFVGAGESPGPGDNERDPGNLGLLKDKTLEVGATYVFTIDMSAGNNNAVLTVIKK